MQRLACACAGCGSAVTTVGARVYHPRHYPSGQYGRAKDVGWDGEGRINIDDLITHIFPLERINEAFESMRDGKASAPSSPPNAAVARALA